MSWISAQIKIKMCLTKCWEQIFDFAKFFGFVGLQRSKNEILPQFSPYLTPKIWKFSQNQKSVPNILWDTFWSWFEPKFTTFGQFARDLLTFLRFSRLKFGNAKWLCPRWRAIKAIGGGSQVKILFLHVFGSKFSVLSPPFYRIPKFRSLAPKLPDLSGWVGGPGGHFRQFGEMWRPNSHKRARICTLMSFKWLNMIQEVFQRLKTRNSVTYLRAGASQSS